MITTIIKVILSIIFLLCLFQMPYGYYQIVRFIGMFGFLMLAYLNHDVNKAVNFEVFVYVGLATLFQPLIKISLGRQIWNIVDVIVSVGLITSLFIKPKKA